MPQATISDSAQSPAADERLLALDAFRGATIAAMILVNNPGNWDSLYWPLGHAAWHGWTPTDLIFPFFVFIMGTALAYSLRKYRRGAAVEPAVYRRIVRRTLVLIALGLWLGLFGKICDIVWGGADGLHLETLRWPGVLQRIGLAYCAASLIALHARLGVQVAIAAALLLGYWAALAKLPTEATPEQRLAKDGNIVRVVDLALIGKNHMYTQATWEPTDPEGLLSTLPAIVTALAGYWAGLFIERSGKTWRTVAWLIVAGLLVAAVGQAWHEWLPINKKLWTSSFVVLTAGLGAAGLGACLAMFDLAGWRRLARPFVVFGVNAIFVFVGSGMLARLLGTIHVGGKDGPSIAGWIYRHGFTDHIADPRLASLGFAVATVAFWWCVLAVMARRGWTIRV
jgi:predicted acyltransferase